MDGWMDRLGGRGGTDWDSCQSAALSMIDTLLLDPRPTAAAILLGRREEVKEAKETSAAEEREEWPQCPVSRLWTFPDSPSADSSSEPLVSPECAASAGTFGSFPLNQHHWRVRTALLAEQLRRVSAKSASVSLVEGIPALLRRWERV